MIQYGDYSFFHIIVSILPSHGSAIGPVMPMMLVTAAFSVIATYMSLYYCDLTGWQNPYDDVGLYPPTAAPTAAPNMSLANSTNASNTSNITFKAGIWETVCDANDEWGASMNNHGHLLIQVAMSFLLVFRSSISYNRYWEGRSTLGAIVKNCRDLGRQFCIYTPGHHIDTSLRYIKVFMPLLTLHLREEGNKQLPEQVNILLQDFELIELKKQRARKPLVILTWISRELKTIRKNKLVSKWEYCAMEQNISDMIGGFNGVDKIRFTPIPFPYAQLLMILLCTYCFSVPFILVKNYRLMTMIPSVILTLALFAINEVGIQIEDPFGTDPNDLPLAGMEKSIMADLNMYRSIGALEVWDDENMNKMHEQMNKRDKADAPRAKTGKKGRAGRP